MAEDLIASGAVEVADGYRLTHEGVKWPGAVASASTIYRYPSSEGDVFTLSQERGEYQIQYGAIGADGSIIWRPDGYQEPVRPYTKTFTMPAGTAYVVVSWQHSANSEAPTLVKVSGGGSMSVLSSAQVTLAWSAGILATTRYYQLAAPTAATPTVPTSSSSLGSWTETEPTADVTKVLWTCERTVYADGTESWSKASKSTSYEAAKDAKSTATDAQAKAEALATVIHDGDDGVSVGKSADGGVTYPQGRTRQSSDAFEVLDDSGKTLSSFSKDKVRLGVGSSTSEIDMADGHGKIFGYLDPQIADPGDGITELRISSDKFLTLHGANEALLYATPSSTVVEYQNSTHAEINVSSEIDDHTFSSDVRLEATAVDETDSDYETKSTITMLASDGATLNGAQILTAPTVLFYNESQAIDMAIPLSDSAGNYKRLKIFYKSDDSDYCSVEVYNPDGKTVALQIARPTYAYAQGAAPVMYVKSKIVKISGAIIDTVKVNTYGGGSNYLRMQKNLGSSGSSGFDMADKVGIIRVEGYKW